MYIPATSLLLLAAKAFRAGTDSPCKNGKTPTSVTSAYMPAVILPIMLNASTAKTLIACMMKTLKICNVEWRRLAAGGTLVRRFKQGIKWSPYRSADCISADANMALI